MAPIHRTFTRRALALLIAAGVFGCDKTDAPSTAAERMQGKTNQDSSSHGSVDDDLSRRWREESLRYVSSVNALVERGMKDGWENAGNEPEDTRQPMAEAVIAAVRHANEARDFDGLRQKFPPAHIPFIELLEENGQSIPKAILLDDGRVVLRIGAPYEQGYVAIIDDLTFERLSADVITIGRSPNRRYFAIARKSGITIHDGWNGPVTTELRWPTGQEGIPEGFDIIAADGPPTVTRLIPFPQGDRALLVSSEGVFVLAEQGPVRILPTTARMREHFEWSKKEHPDDPPSYSLSMEHGAISPDGSLIATGDQDSLHLVFDAKTLKVVGEIGNRSEYPHFACFSSDGKMIAFNSCHFYNGVSIGVPTRLLPGLKTEPYEPDDRVVELEDSARVYAAVCRGDEFIVGDAHGYLRAFDTKGHFRWQHFIGSTVGDIDVGRDGKRLVVTTYAGFVSFIDLDTSEADPFIIGTATHKERRRWLFWKNEKTPLVW